MALSVARLLRRSQSVKPAAIALLNTTRHYADGPTSTLSLTFGTPTQAFFNGDGVDQVDIPSTTGSFGVLPNHVPIIAALKPGVVTVYKEGSQQKFIVSSGTVTVNADSTAQILAEEAAPVDNFDLGAAEQALDQATATVSSTSGEEERAAAMVQVEAYEAIVRALERQ